MRKGLPHTRDQRFQVFLPQFAAFSAPPYAILKVENAQDSLVEVTWSMNWLMWMLFSTFLLASISVVDKKLMNTHGLHPAIATASFGIVALPVGIIGLIVVEPIPPLEAAMGLGAGGLFIIAAWLYYGAVVCEDISRIVPLLRLTSVQTALLGRALLGERMTRQEQMAFAFIIAGSVLVSLKSDESGLRPSRTAGRVVLVTSLLAISRILMTQVYRSTSLWAGVVWEQTGMALMACLLAGTWAYHSLRKGRLTRGTFPDRQVWGVLIVEQSIRFVAGLASGWALVQGVPVGLVSVLSGLRPAWVWLLATLWLQESCSKRECLLRAGGIGAITFGVYLLT